MELIIFIGLPASGKSTLYHSHFASTHLLISKDLLKNNRRRDRRQRQLLEEAFMASRSVVLDNTHPSRASRQPWLEWAAERHIPVKGYYVSASVEECRRRNESREPRDQVPDVGFFTILGQLERPSLAEGFEELYFVSQVDGRTVIEEWKSDEN